MQWSNQIPLSTALPLPLKLSVVISIQLNDYLMIWRRNNCLPNTICYNSLIAATSNDANRAYQLLEEMYRRCDAGERFVKPNTITYNTVLGAMAESSSSSPVPPHAAQALLEDMKRRTAAGEAGVRPDHVTYSTLISIWTDSNVGFEVSERVEVLLEEMTRL